MSADLISDQSTANISHQTVELLRILGVLKELRKIVSGCDCVQGLANRFQFPSDHPTSDSVHDLEEYGLTVPVCFPSLSRQQHHPQG